MVTSYEYATKLKLAGFPQPEPKSGQDWYDQQGNYLRISVHDMKEPKGNIVVITNISKMSISEVRLPNFNGFTFAPGITDLLPHTPYFLEWDGNVQKFGLGFDGVVRYFDNPADAMAEYILKNKNPA